MENIKVLTIRMSDRTWVTRGTGAVLHMAGDAPVPGVGQGVVVLVDHGQTWGPLEVLSSQTVLKHKLRCEKTYKIVVSDDVP